MQRLQRITEYEDEATRSKVSCYETLEQVLRISNDLGLWKTLVT